jgi:hypothetical protein
MILLFGDSWARQSTVHINDPEQLYNNSATLANGPEKFVQKYGYRHYDLPDVFVEFQEHSWFNQYFKNHTVLNLAEGGNTVSGIIENIYTRMWGISNLTEKIDMIVYQTDPLRIFAPRADYTNKNIVWPNFMHWCQATGFDHRNCGLHELIYTIMNNFYLALSRVQIDARQDHGLDVNLYLVGGVNRVHDCVDQHEISVLIPSVTEFFGYNNDNIIENKQALHSFVDFWISECPDKRHSLMTEWNYYEVATTQKISYWTSNSQWFAGKHLTSQAFESLAGHIETHLKSLQL